MENKMKLFAKSSILTVVSLLIFTGCQTYFGYNTQSQVTTKADFQKENVEAKQTWERYRECYSKPISDDVHNKLLKEAEKQAGERYGSWRHIDYDTEKRYQSWKNELFEKASHRYRIIRGVKEGVFPSVFLSRYHLPQSFQKAQDEQKIREQQFAVVADELKKMDIPEAVQISSTARSYFYKDGSLYGNYIVKMQEPKLAIEIRSHLYSKNAEWVPPFVFLRYPFDFIACFCGDWELAEHKPDIFTLISYCPPFSWFFTRTPPYFTGPSAQRTKYQVIISPQDTVVVDRKKIQKVSESEVAQAVKWLKNKAEEGDAIAQFDLAMLYDAGKHIEKDTNKALELFGSAVKSGNASVEERIISLLSVDKIEAIANKINDSPRKMRILKVAADKGSVTAQYSYAALCERSNDSKQALQYYKIAADKGDVESAIAICRLSNYWDKDFNAEKYITTAKNAGDNNGLRLYAYRLKDIDESVKTVKDLADKGDAISQAEIAVFLGYGRWNAVKAPEDALAESFAMMLGKAQTLRQLDYEQALVYMQKSVDNGIKSVNIKGEILDAKSILSDLKHKVELYHKSKVARQNAEQDFKRQAKGFTLLEDVVKKSVFNIDRSRTVQEALSAQMTNLKWRHFQNKRNQTVVEVVGTWKHDKYKGQLLSPQKGDEVMVQFIILRSGYSHVKFHYGEIRDKNGVAKNLVAVIGEMKYIMLSAVTSDMGIDPDSFFKGLYDMN